MGNFQYDITVIGSGPGGYVAAIRLAQLGFRTALIEKYDALGGTCLNVGCIPSKALLDSSEHFFNASHNFKTHGINLTNLKVDMNQMIERKNQVVSQTVEGVKFLMKKNKITVYYGFGSFENQNTLSITKKDGTQEMITSEKFIIATGSKPYTIPGVEIDKTRIITSTEALNLKEVPKSMIVIGGGVIGLEMGSVFARLGTKIKVIEYTDSLIPAMDLDLGKEIQKVLSKELGFEFFFKHKVTGASVNGKKAKVIALNSENQEVNFEADYVLVAVGRRPYTDGLGLDKVGVKLDNRGKVEVNDDLQTNIPNIYAIGDVIRGAMLAHKASEEGIYLAEKLAGQKPHIHYLLIPNVVYTWPEVAGVGYTEQELKEKGIPYKKGKFDFRNLGRSRASMDLEGFVKILAHKDTDEILGMHIIGPRAADLIAEGVVAMEFRASAEDLAIFSHAHPTFAEAIKEAALDATAKRALHM